MGSRVVVVQHGEKVREPGDPGLTDQGRQQALATARYVVDRFAPSEVWASPLRRATDDRSFLPTSGDSSEGAATRFLEAITQIAGDAGPSDTVAVVAHGGITVDSLRTIVGDAHIRDVRPELIENGVPCGAVTILERADATWRLVQFPSVEHLDQSVEHRPA